MKVNITYFKANGKHYTDEDVEWPPDLTHYSKWAPFERIVRIKTMHAVCLANPLGYPQMRPADKEEH